MSGVDVKCPHCDMWLTDNPDKKPYAQRTDYGFILQCGNCLLHSYWNCIVAPVPLECDHTGKLLELEGEVRAV
jgi:hypothetical protein